VPAPEAPSPSSFNSEPLNEGQGSLVQKPAYPHCCRKCIFDGLVKRHTDKVFTKLDFSVFVSVKIQP
jgi:hypothetical protein